MHSPVLQVIITPFFQERTTRVKSNAVPLPVFASPDCKHNIFALSGGNTYAENGCSPFSFLRSLGLVAAGVMRDALREQSALSAAYMRGAFGRRNDDRPGEARR